MVVLKKKGSYRVCNAVRKKIMVSKVTCQYRNGHYWMNNNSWQMLNIFYENFHSPVLMAKVVEGKEDKFNIQLPKEITIFAYERKDTGKGISRVLKRKRFQKKIQLMLEKCDAIYVRLPDWDALEAAIVGQKLRKKMIVSLHGDWPEVYKDLSKNGRFFSKPRNLFLANKSAYWTRMVAQMSDFCFCVGNDLEEKYGNLSSRSLSFANYLHQNEEIKPYKDTCLNPMIKMLFVGRLEKRKGVNFLVLALDKLNKKGFSFECNIVGDGPERGKLEKLVYNRKLNKKVNFQGYVNFGKGLDDFYAQADIFILPSVAGEGCPKVIVEAMSNSLPVIATKIGNIENMVVNGETGILIDPGDTAEIVLAIEELVLNQNLRRKIICGGLRFAKANGIEHHKQIVRQGLLKCVPEFLF